MKRLLAATMLLASVTLAPTTLAHDGDGEGASCHSDRNAEMESFCDALDEATEPVTRLFPLVCTDPVELDVGPVHLTVDSVCI